MEVVMVSASEEYLVDLVAQVWKEGILLVLKVRESAVALELTVG